MDDAEAREAFFHAPDAPAPEIDDEVHGRTTVPAVARGSGVEGVV